MDLLRTIFRRAIRQPFRTVIIDDRGSYTSGKLILGAMHIAGHIDRSTAQPRVGLLLPTGGAMAMSLIGTWLAGRVPIPLNYLLSEDELAHVVKDSGIDTIFAVRQLIDFIGGEKVIPPGVKIVWVEELSFAGLPPLYWPGDFAADDPGVILYTSGTSGKPKGVVLTHNNLYTNVIGGIELAKLRSADAFLGVLPQFHTFGLTATTLVPLHLGAKIIYSARFVPRKIVELIRKHRPDVLLAVPSMFKALADVKDISADDFTSLRFTVTGGEPLSDTLRATYQEKLGVRLLEGYGLTETSPIVAWSTPFANKPKSVGQLLPRASAVIVDEDLKPLPIGQDGEILVGGPGVMAGYFNQPQMTADVMADVVVDGVKSRWFRTGDMGRFDEDGYLYITGRLKEAMKIGGMLVFPRSIEEAINKHPSVKEAAVIGKPDEVRGEVPVAYVELREGVEFDEMAIRKFAREHLAQYKVPREIIRVDALPRNPTGKVLRRKLAELPITPAATPAPAETPA